MSHTKADIAERICIELGDYSIKRASELVESTLEIIKNTLEDGEDVLISGFGKFRVRNKNSRLGRNPLSGEAFTLGAKKVVTFRCSRVLKGKLNGKSNRR